jgi:hypothetical protein
LRVPPKDLPTPPEYDEDDEREALLAQQPALADATFNVTSPSTATYNCIAWTAGDSRRNWSPAVGPGGKQLGGFYWPETVEMLPAVKTVEAVFQLLGYEACADGIPEDGVEKIAIYGDALGLALHAARQLGNGRWTSKMGDKADIEHDTPEAVESHLYGQVCSYMARCRRPPVVETGQAQLLLPP